MVSLGCKSYVLDLDMGVCKRVIMTNIKLIKVQVMIPEVERQATAVQNEILVFIIILLLYE